MEDPRRLDQHDGHPPLQAGDADVLEGPVPVVVVEVAEPRVAGVEAAPRVATERHAHVVLRAHPPGDGNLGGTGVQIMRSKDERGGKKKKVITVQVPTFCFIIIRNG